MASPLAAGLALARGVATIATELPVVGGIAQVAGAVLGHIETLHGRFEDAVQIGERVVSTLELLDLMKANAVNFVRGRREVEVHLGELLEAMRSIEAGVVALNQLKGRNLVTKLWKARKQLAMLGEFDANLDRSLGELTRLSVEASSFVPQQLDAQTAVAASEMMVPDATQRQKHMTPEVQIAVQRALHARHRLSSQPNFSIDEFFTPEICELVICALLKQLSEKLDIVRKCAGEILQQLLESTKPRIPYIPARPALMGALELSDARPTIETNWALAHVSFPMIVKMMLLDNDRYHDAIVR